MSQNIQKDIIQDSDYTKYLAELKNYYDLKNKYKTMKQSYINKLISQDNTIEAKKKLLAKQKFNCVNCGKPVGTIFIENNKILKAVCGSTNDPCDLDIEIIKMTPVLIDEELEKINTLLKNTKKNIITTKLDFLFKYIQEDVAVEKFDKLKEELNLNQEKYNELFLLYKSITKNSELEKLLEEKQIEHNNLLSDYKDFIELFNKTTETRYLKDAVRLYVSQIRGLDKNIFDMKHKHNHIEEIEDNVKLIQEKYNIRDLELIKKPE